MTAYFYTLLYIIGLFCVLPLSKKIPLWLMVCTGFLWGVLVWVFCSTIILLFGFAFTVDKMIFLLSFVVLIAAGINIYQKSLKLPPAQYLLILFGAAVIYIISHYLTINYYIFATEDSFSIILFSRVLAKSGLLPWTINQFSEWGLIVPVLNMASSLLGEDFISGYQTIFAGILVLVMSISFFKAFSEYFKPILALLFSSILVLIFMTIIFIEHAVYIHTNIAAAVFIYIALYSFWNYLKNESTEWAILVSIAMIGIGFSRIEGPLYVILFSSLAICSKQLKYRDKLSIIFPYTILGIFWYFYLLIGIDQAGLLNKTNVIIIIISLAGFLIFGVISKWIPRINRLQILIPGVLVVGLISAFILKPNHMVTSLLHVVMNLTSRNSWGFTWIVIILFIPLVIELNPKEPGNRYLLLCIISYLVLVLLLAFPRIPYRLGKTDSANRLILQIQPIILLYISINSNKIKDWLFAIPAEEK